MKSEVASYIRDAEDRMLEMNLKDVYVTDHKPVTKKFVTQSEEEDLEYYNYIKSLEHYNE